MYRTTATCPVCNAVLTTVMHSQPHLNALAAFAAVQPHWHAHMEAAPACVAAPLWSRGYELGDPVYEPAPWDPPTRVEDMAVLLDALRVADAAVAALTQEWRVPDCWIQGSPEAEPVRVFQALSKQLQETIQQRLTPGS